MITVCQVPRVLRRGLLAAVLVGLSAGASMAAGPGSSFLKNGDRWLLIGDSITHNDTYRQLVLLMLRHYHPDADIMVGNSAVNGVASDYTEKREFTPTVVTVMLGMNDVIHEDWPFTPNTAAKIEGYRRNITATVRKYKELGAEVVLMTPTYTDERFSTFFNVAMTRRFLEAYGQVVREIAAAEHCHWLPVAEEMEAFQNTLGIDQHLRHDGVHPSGLGQYQIARTLWQRLNVAGELKGSRKLVEPTPPLVAEVRLASRFMHAPTNGVVLTLSTPQATEATVTWSLEAARGSTTMALGPTGVSWRVPVSEAALQMPAGSFKRMVVEVASGDRRKVCVVDLACTRVVKLADGKASGEIRSESDRPEGRLVGAWSIEDAGDTLWFSGTVNDSELSWKAYWPFQRDGIQLWLDLRPAERFGGIGLDRDVADVFVSVRDQPAFCVAPVAWVGPRLMYATWAGGEKTPAGYAWRCGIGGKVSDVRSLDLPHRDLVGVGLVVCDNDEKPAATSAYHPIQRLAESDLDVHPNLMMILDRKGKLPGETTTSLHLFP